MPKRSMTLAAWAVGLISTLLFSACGAPSSSSTPPQNPEQTQSAPGDDQPSHGDDQSFEGTVSTETITANQMEIEIPTGIRIPVNSLVTSADPTSIMIADADESAVVKAVTDSAQQAGYEVYAEVPGGKVFVGHGNAVLLSAFPNAQILTWGPESMKDVLSNG